MNAGNHFDVAIIGGGPAGCAAAIKLARAGARVVVFEKGSPGRDKVCGDGLTPRAVAALSKLEIDFAASHHIDGLRMIANNTRRELLWPETPDTPAAGAVWKRTELDAALMEAAAAAGAEMRYETEALPELDSDRVSGVRVGDGELVTARLTILASGPQGDAARMVGAVRDPNEPFGLAMRAYVESPRHDEAYIEANLTMSDEHGAAVPGYGWMFPCGDGTVNIGVGALSTMKGFKKLNLNNLMQIYKAQVPDWSPGEFLDRPRAWRLPMSALKRHGDGWLAIGDAAGLVNPMNGEGIDYALESGIIAAEAYLAGPDGCEDRYDRQVAESFDGFLRLGRRFSFLVGHPFILKTGLRFAVSTDSISRITLAVMANLVDSGNPGVSGKVMTAADKSLALSDPLLRRFQARS